MTHIKNRRSQKIKLTISKEALGLLIYGLQEKIYSLSRQKEDVAYMKRRYSYFRLKMGALNKMCDEVVLPPVPETVPLSISLEQGELEIIYAQYLRMFFYDKYDSYLKGEVGRFAKFLGTDVATKVFKSETRALVDQDVADSCFGDVEPPEWDYDSWANR